MLSIMAAGERAGVPMARVSSFTETRERSDTLCKSPERQERDRRHAAGGSVALFLPGMEVPFYTDLIRAVYAHCERQRISLQVHIGPDMPDAGGARSIGGGDIQGAIVLNERLSPEALAAMHRGQALPLVFLDREVSGPQMSSVVLSNYDGLSQALEYLVHTGHRHIGFLRGPQSYDGASRNQAYLDCMNRIGLAIPEPWVLQGDFMEESAYQAVRDNLTRGLRLPDALLCANDDMAQGAMRAFEEAGIAVPEQVSVVGFDDDVFAKDLMPPLTTVGFAVEDLVELAMQALSRLLSGEAGQVYRVGTQLVMRKSVAMRFGRHLA